MAADVASVGPESGDLNCEAALSVNFFLRGGGTMIGRGRSVWSDGFDFVFSCNFGDDGAGCWKVVRSGMFELAGEAFINRGERNGEMSFLCCNF